MLLRRRGFVLLAPLVGAACGSPNPNYYSIVARSGPTVPAGPKVVAVKDIGLASYLDRREIVRSSEGYRLDIMSNDWWGEPLGDMLGRVLVMELSQRLPAIATELQDALTKANRLMGSLNTGYGDESRFRRDLDRLLPQLTDAARSIRALTDLLSRHPEALIQGRPAGGKE